jgi:IS5 family transposase
MLCITCQAMDETTILNFRHLLERHGLTEAIFAEVNAHLTDKGITGGFNRSSQHFNFGGVDDKNRQTKIRTVHAGQIILARATACLAT